MHTEILYMSENAMHVLLCAEMQLGVHERLANLAEILIFESS